MAKALVKYPYDVFKEILLASNISVDFATKIRVFNVWFAANESKLAKDELAMVFKDYRMFVARDVAVYQPNKQQYICKKCYSHYHF